MDNPYEVLGVSETATESEIKTAFRERAIECHPDQASHLSDQEAKEEFIRVRKAFDILNDPAQRENFDTNGSTETQTEPEKYEDEWKGFEKNGDEVIEWIIESHKNLATGCIGMWTITLKTSLYLTPFVSLIPLAFINTTSPSGQGPFLLGPLVVGFVLSIGISLPYSFYKAAENNPPPDPPWVE
jgi:curved DNA-binding protein CbpA